MSKYGIDKDVWRVVVFGKEEAPYRIALAASMCPAILGELTEQSEEDSEGFVVWMPYRSLHEAENSTVARECHDRSASVVIRNALAKWTMAQEDAEQALRSLSYWDRELASWCAMDAAQTAFKYRAKGGSRPRITIELAQRWVMGRTSERQVRNDVGAANAAYYAASNSFKAGSDRSDAGYAAYWAAQAAAYASGASFLDSKWEAARDAELVRLREVIAGAIMSYPTSDTTASGGLVGGRTLVAGAAGLLIGAGIMRAARKS